MRRMQTLRRRRPTAVRVGRLCSHSRSRKKVTRVLRTSRKTRGGQHQHHPNHLNHTIHKKLVSELSPVEQHQINELIKSAFENAGLHQVDATNLCIFVAIEKSIVSVMFLKIFPVHMLESPKERVYIHTVSVSEKHRGMGLLHKMLKYLGRISRFKDAVFELTAANTVDHGLDQVARFQIYSKSGFSLPTGTVVEPSGYKVLSTDFNAKPQKSIMYTMQKGNTGQKLRISYRDIHPTACVMNNVKQERGCIMESNSQNLRDFNTT
jgi:hypothetical protein